MSYIMILLAAFSLDGCKSKSEDISHFSQTIYSPRYAGGFEITGSDGRNSTLITVSKPWQGADSVYSSLLICRDGESVPDGYSGQVLHGDARRVIVMSSTDIAMLDAIGAVDKVVGASGVRYIANQYICDKKDSIGEVGYEGNIDYEQIIALDPDIVMLYGVNGASSMEGKLKELCIPYIYIGDYLEESPVGKAEWMVVLAEIVGCRDKGIEVFGSIPQRYEILKKLVADASCSRPAVMLNMPYADSWFMPPVNSYMVRLIEDAGGDYLFSDNDSGVSVPIDIETAYMFTSRADVWLNVGTAQSIADVKRMVNKVADVPCVDKGELYNNNLRQTSAGGNDFFESGVVHPDLILRDLINIFHPGLLSGEETEMIYYKKLE